MRWEDERYVRVYNRDTLDWLALSFDAQSLLMHVLRKVDRAGILHLGRHGKRGVALIIGAGAHWDRLEPALEELLADGCLVLQGDRLVVRNFVQAQETQQSEAARKRAQRERDRDKAMAAGMPEATSQQGIDEMGKRDRADKLSHPVVTPDVPSPPGVPDKLSQAGHAVTKKVTPAVLCRAEPAVPSVPETTHASASPPVAAPTDPIRAMDSTLFPGLEALEDRRQPGVEDLRDAWNELTALPIPRWGKTSDGRRKAAQRALTRRPFEEWREVFRRIGRSTFCQGDGDQRWIADVDWAMRPEGKKPEPAATVLDGKFDARPRAPPRGRADPNEGLGRVEQFDAPCAHHGCQERADGEVWNQPVCFTHAEWARLEHERKGANAHG